MEDLNKPIGALEPFLRSALDNSGVTKVGVNTIPPPTLLPQKKASKTKFTKEHVTFLKYVNNCYKRAPLPLNKIQKETFEKLIQEIPKRPGKGKKKN
jgi:hypothetical protein